MSWGINNNNKKKTLWNYNQALKPRLKKLNVKGKCTF
jgi:hypothetical protein